jgi:hemerythrin-like domain-containing protein
MEDATMAALQDNSAISAICMEHQILEHVKQAMRVTLNWHAPDVSLPRKLSSLQFTIKSFQRHLERVMNLEEEGGYMAEVVDDKPYLQNRITFLAGDHQRFRDRLRKLLPELNAISEWERPRFVEVCDDLTALLDEIDRHDKREIELLQESAVVDDGGEG